jgi:transposase
VAQMERLRPFFPRSGRKPRDDDRRVLSGIIYIKNNGLQWKDAPAAYGAPKTPYNRFVRLSRMGVFAWIFLELAQPGPDGDMIMIDSTYRKAHRTAASLPNRVTRPRAIGRTDGGSNSKLLTVFDARSAPNLLPVARLDERCKECTSGVRRSAARQCAVGR